MSICACQFSRVCMKPLARTVIVTLFLTSAASTQANNESAARDLAQSSGCFKCHGVDKKKDGPALRDVAAKYKGVADAETKLIYHVTSGEMVKFDDGHEEHHKKVKTNSFTTAASPAPMQAPKIKETAPAAAEGEAAPEGAAEAPAEGSDEDAPPTEGSPESAAAAEGEQA